MDIEWEDPPEDAIRGQRRGTYIEFVVALKAHPNKWARVPGERTDSSAKAFAQNVRRAKVKGFEPAGAFDAATHDGKVWACYLGDPPPVPQAATGEEDAEEDIEPDEPDAGSIPPQVPMPSVASLTQRVRRWASEQGMPQGDRGRISKEVFDAYFAATGEPDPRPRVV